MRLAWLLIVGLTLLAVCDTARAQDPPPSSYDLIEQARDAGKLSDAKAVVLGLQALAQPGKLPKAYRGGDVDASQIMTDVNLALPGLSRGERRKVAPFLLPPYARQSAWLSKRLRKKAGTARATTAAADCVTYDTVRHDVWNPVAAGPRGVVYYNAKSDRAAARSMATQLKTKILPTLTKLFKAPLPTASTGCAEFGGARKLQVYIVDQDVLQSVAKQKAIAVTSVIYGDPKPCGPRATFVLMPKNGTKQDLAHEVMHSVQFAYQRCDFLPAFVEGTAMLAQDLVYPGDPNKQRYFQTIHSPLVSLLDETDSHEYSTWAFWYALGRPAGADPAARSKIVRSILTALGTTGATVIGAVEQLVPGGWRGAFERFAVQRFNAAPVGSPGSPEPESFIKWDAWTESPAPGAFRHDVTLGGKTASTTEFTTKDRRSLSTEYDELTISDPRVRALQVEAEVGPDDLVQGFLELADGRWRVEDWTDAGASALLCRDKPDENVTRIIVAISNVSPAGGQEGPGTYTVQARDRCDLPRVYRGSFTKRDEDGFVVNGTVTFTRSDTRDLPGQAEYELTAGSATWSLDRTDSGGCEVSGSGSQSLTDYRERRMTVEDATRSELNGHRDPATEPLPWYIWTDVQPFFTNVDVTRTCPGDPPEDVSDYAEPITLRIGWSEATSDDPPRPHYKQADPLVLEGTYVDTYGTSNVDTYTFRLVGADA